METHWTEGETERWKKTTSIRKKKLYNVGIQAVSAVSVYTKIAFLKKKITYMEALANYNEKKEAMNVNWFIWIWHAIDDDRKL